MSALTQVKGGNLAVGRLSMPTTAFPSSGISSISQVGTFAESIRPGTSGSRGGDPRDGQSGGDCPHRRVACAGRAPAGPNPLASLSPLMNPRWTSLLGVGGSLDVSLKEGDEYHGWKVIHLSATGEKLPL